MNKKCIITKWTQKIIKFEIEKNFWKITIEIKMQQKEFASELNEDKFVINISNHYFYPQLNYFINIAR